MTPTAADASTPLEFKGWIYLPRFGYVRLVEDEAHVIAGDAQDALSADVRAGRRGIEGGSRDGQ